MSQHTTTHVGLDVSKASISVALLRPDGRLDEERIANTPEAVRPARAPLARAHDGARLL